MISPYIATQGQVYGKSPHLIQQGGILYHFLSKSTVGQVQ